LQKELEYEQRNLRLAEQRALINKARARRLAIENGDIPTDLEPPPPIQTAPLILIATSPPTFEIQLPKAEPPPKFEGRNRSQLNSWIRGCERYINGSNALNTPPAQVNFALRYLGDNQVEFWERALRGQGENPLEGTWPLMKKTMLDSLGSSWERKQTARAKIRTANQRHYTPTELLNYLKTQWEELDERSALDDNNEDHIHDFYSALDKRIKTRLDAQPVEWTSLVALESRANQHHRWVSTNDREGRDKQSRPAPNDSQRDYNAGKRPRLVQSRRTPPPGEGARPNQALPARVAVDFQAPRKDKSSIECYYCHLKGHYKNECRKLLKDQEQGKDNP
jgi:hypothetical protein